MSELKPQETKTQEETDQKYQNTHQHDGELGSSTWGCALQEIVEVIVRGQLVEILPGTDGLVHISEMAQGHVDKAEERAALLSGQARRACAETEGSVAELMTRWVAT